MAILILESAVFSILLLESLFVLIHLQVNVYQSLGYIKGIQIKMESEDLETNVDLSRKCAVKSCGATKPIKSNKIRLFRFPSADKVFGKIWRKKCKIDKPYKKRLFICNKHFANKYLGIKRLKLDAVPTLYLDEDVQLTEKDSNSLPTFNRRNNCDEEDMKVVTGSREKPPEFMTEFQSVYPDHVHNDIISDRIPIIKEEPSEFMTEFETAAPEHLSMQYEIINDPITIVKEEPSEYISEFKTSPPDHLSMQFEIINDPISIVKEEPSEMIINEYFSPSSNDRTMPREDDQSKADNIAPTKIICDDDHMLFLRSLLPFFKKLDISQTLRLRNKFKELLTQEINSNNA